MNAHHPKTIEKLIELNNAIHDDHVITESDREFVLASLDDDDPVARYFACTLATELDKPMIKKIIKHFKNFRPDIQKPLYLFLSTTDDVEAFAFLIDSLQKELPLDLVNIIEKGLSKTEYPILPLLLNRLYTTDRNFSIRLQSVLKKIGFSRIELYLSLMPQIPHERTFRLLFGDEKINRVKYK